MARGDFARAERLLARILSASPSSTRANELMAYIAGRQGDSRAVLKFLTRATSSPGASANSWHLLGVWYQKNREPARAVSSFEKALALDGEFFAAAHDLGLVSFELGNPDKALHAYDRAAAIHPDSFEVFHNRGRALHALRRYEDALESYTRAIELRPDHAATWVNRGETLNDLRRYREALADYGRALELKPGDDDAQWNESLTRLLLGQFEVGWRKYESRWRGSGAARRRHTSIPAWNAEESLLGKRILVWWEQGFGDTIQFCRYAPLLHERGAQVVVEVQPPLKSLVGRLEYCTVIADGDEVPACDYQVPLLSLPLAFKTTLSTIPASTPYLSPDPELARLWSLRVASATGRKKIGIACSGHSAQKDNRSRSMELRELAPLEELGDLFLIQVAIAEDDRRYLRESGSGIRTLDREIADFHDSAAIVANMDVVVTIDTSLAHLAGALGKPVFIMLPWTPTWRWMAGRDDSPWYPSATLCRQEAAGDWAGVVSRVKSALLRRPEGFGSP